MATKKPPFGDFLDEKGQDLDLNLKFSLIAG